MTPSRTRGRVTQYQAECGLCQADIMPGDWVADSDGEVCHAECVENLTGVYVD